MSLHYSVPSGPPRNVKLNPQGPRTLRISWDQPSFSTRNGPIVGYILNITNSEGQSLPLIYTRIRDTSLLQSFLFPYMTYTVKIAAATEVGHGPFTFGTDTKMPEDGELWHVFVVAALNKL